jgi:membrane-bound metal-dependent hydrolase YbcI (DUF457 family)
VSWAAHEFENYLVQRHAGARASFLAIVVGTQLPDLFTKTLAYGADEPARFHRGWPGVGFTHSLAFGVVVAGIVLVVANSRPWAFGLLLGQWAHVVADLGDTAGVMLFFPFSLEPVSLGLWKHAGAAGRYGDAAAYYSSLGVVWDLLWLALTLLAAWRVLTREYFASTVVPADPKVWLWLRRRLRLSASSLLLLYRGVLFYGVARMTVWFLYARFDARVPFQPVLDGPAYLPAGVDPSDAGLGEVLLETAAGGVLFAGYLVAAWELVGRRLWERAASPAAVAATGEVRT